MIEHMGSLSHNLGSLVEAGIIEKNHTITSGINIKKAIIALEILREAIIETKNYIKSNLYSMKDMLVSIERDGRSRLYGSKQESVSLYRRC